jgi:hypothetical protein
MPVVIMSVSLSKSYTEWKKAFDSAEPVRRAAGMQVIYVGHELKDPQTARIVQRVASLETMAQFVKDNADLIKESGALPDTIEVTPCSD